AGRRAACCAPGSCAHPPSRSARRARVARSCRTRARPSSASSARSFLLRPEPFCADLGGFVLGPLAALVVAQQRAEVGDAHGAVVAAAVLFLQLLDAWLLRLAPQFQGVVVAYVVADTDARTRLAEVPAHARILPSTPGNDRRGD